MSDDFKSIRQEVLDAYSDCNSLSRSRRNLNFRSSKSVSVSDAVEIMSKAIEGGYNNFSPNLLDLLPSHANVWIAREGSVCIYVDCELSSKQVANLQCDEYDSTDNPNVYRLWWD